MSSDVVKDFVVQGQGLRGLEDKDLGLEDNNKDKNLWSKDKDQDLGLNGKGKVIIDSIS